MEKITDYKKWLYYESGLQSGIDYLNLYNTLETIGRTDGIQCEKIDDRYIVTMANDATFHLDEPTRIALLNYLRDHYTQVPQDEPTPETAAASSTGGQSGPSNPGGIWRLLAHASPANQSFRFAVLAILLFQVIFVPKEIFEREIPQGMSFAYLGFLILIVVGCLHAYAYRKIYKPVMRFSLIFSLAFLFSLFFFYLYYIEIVVTMVLLDKPGNALAALFMFVMYNLIAVLTALVLSVINYFVINSRQFFSQQ